MPTRTSTKPTPQQWGSSASFGLFFILAPIFMKVLSPDWVSALVDAVISVAVGVSVKKVVERRRGL